MLCDFLSIDDGIFQCSRCGVVVETEDFMTPTLPCSYLDINSKDKNLADKIKDMNNLLNTSKDLEMGSNEEIVKRFKICELCEYFQNNSCIKCGCSINRTRNHMNKLTWKNEKCPIDKW